MISTNHYSLQGDKVKIYPSVLTQKIIHLQGQPISLVDRDYLLPIYDANHKFIVLKAGRQCEKSTTICCKIITYCVGNMGFNSLYITCTRPQAKDFSDLKLDPIMDNSPEIQRRFITRKLRYQQNVFFKKFINGSTIKLRYAMTRKNIYQGLSADLNAIDEIQDIPSDVIALINETLSHSKYKYKVYAGTPKGADNTLDYYWDLSTQNEWFVHCEHCNLWNYIDLKNIGKDYLICRKCGKQIQPENGRWVSLNPDSHIAGYRLPQLIVPWKQDSESWRELLLNMENYSEQEIYNLILGLPFGLGTKPISEYELRRICVSPFYDKPGPEILKYPRIAGIDWGTGLEGKSDSIMVILAIINSDDYRVLTCKRYHGSEWVDQTKTVADMTRIMQTFDVNAICTDWGHGPGQNDMLRNTFGWEKVWVMYYSATAKPKIKWNPDGQLYVLNKTIMLNDLFESMKKEKILFPTWNKFEGFAKDILAEHMEVDSKSRRIYYDHNPKTPDDSLHAVNYAKIGADLFLRKL